MLSWSSALMCLFIAAATHSVQAPKVRAGTPLRVKGVDIGSVTSVTPGLDQVAVGVEVRDCVSQAEHSPNE